MINLRYEKSVLRQLIKKISQCVPKLAKLAVFTNLLLTARLEFILGKQSPFFVTTQLAGSGSEAQYFYKLGDSMTQILSPESMLTIVLPGWFSG